MGNVNKIVEAVGSMAEMSTIYYTTLISCGMPKDAATALTAEFIKSLISESLKPDKKEKTNKEES